MKYCIRPAALSLLAVLLGAGMVAAADDDAAGRDRDAAQVAEAWFVSLMQGETAVTAALSAVPFSFDGKHQVQSLAELKSLYDQVVEKKGKRDVKPAERRIEASSPDEVKVVLMVGGEGVVVTVRPGEVFRVTGFRD